MKILQPDYYVSNYFVMDEKWLLAQNINLVFADIDNTLTPYGKTENETLDVWITQLHNAGIKVIGTSNTSNQRGEQFRKEHKIEVLSNCRKPKITVLQHYFDRENVNIKKALLVGDQLSTDILCGNRLHVKTALVEPIKENAPFYKKVIWLLEVFFLRWRGVK